MRKLALTGAALALMITALPAAGQDDVAKNRFGFVAGVNAAKLGGFTVTAQEFPGGVLSVQASRRWGMQIGGIYEHSIGAFGFLRIEPKFVQKGSKLDVGTKVGTTTSVLSTEIDLSYIDVPIMLRSVYFQKKGQDWFARPFIQVGVGPNFLLSAKFEGEDVKSAFKSLEWGLTTTIGLTGKVGKAEWSADFRLLSSLARIDDGAASKVKNSGMGGGISFTFPFGK
jgi:hypothetical protein